jgi:hypothetical protein
MTDWFLAMDGYVTMGHYGTVEHPRGFADETVDRSNSTCSGAKRVIGRMRGTVDSLVVDESRTPSWTVVKSSQKSRMRRWTE